MAIRSTGEMGPDDMNEMNVPVVCFIHEPDEDSSLWRWTAVNFMPRKEELLEWVREKVVPLYEAATNNLREFGKNYYWEPQTPGSA